MDPSSRDRELILNFAFFSHAFFSVSFYSINDEVYTMNLTPLLQSAVPATHPRQAGEVRSNPLLFLLLPFLPPPPNGQHVFYRYFFCPRSLSRTLLVQFDFRSSTLNLLDGQQPPSDDEAQRFRSSSTSPSLLPSFLVLPSRLQLHHLHLLLPTLTFPFPSLLLLHSLSTLF